VKQEKKKVEPQLCESGRISELILEYHVESRQQSGPSKTENYEGDCPDQRTPFACGKIARLGLKKGQSIKKVAKKKRLRRGFLSLLE